MDKNDPIMIGMRIRIRELRREMHLSKLEFAEKMGVNQNTWSNIEAGVNPFSKRYVNLVCLSYNISQEWLMTGEGDTFLPEKKSLDECEIDGMLIEIENSKKVPQDFKDLLNAFKELTPKNKRTVLDYVDMVLKVQRNTLDTNQE